MFDSTKQYIEYMPEIFRGISPEAEAGERAPESVEKPKPNDEGSPAEGEHVENIRTGKIAPVEDLSFAQAEYEDIDLDDFGARYERAIDRSLDPPKEEQANIREITIGRCLFIVRSMVATEVERYWDYDSEPGTRFEPFEALIPKLQDEMTERVRDQVEQFVDARADGETMKKALYPQVYRFLKDQGMERRAGLKYDY